MHHNEITNHLRPNKLVWLGTNSKLGGRDSMGHNCDGWHSDSLNKLGFASPLHSPKGHHHNNNHHQQQQQQQQQLRSQHPGSSRRVSKERRFAVDAASAPNEDNLQTRGQNNYTSNAKGSNLVFDVLEKYPCRMPLIVLCMETIAQGE